jgi:hypothetical protein
MAQKHLNSVKASKPALNALVRLMVLTLAGLDRRSVMPDENYAVVGSSSRKDQGLYRTGYQQGMGSAQSGRNHRAESGPANVDATALKAPQHP